MAAPQIITDKDIARLAFTEAERTSEVPLPADLLEDAHYYVAEGFGELKRINGRDPRVYAKPTATSAVIAYTKARLLGVPVDATEWPVRAQRWLHDSAIADRIIKGTTTATSKRKIKDDDGLFITRRAQVGMVALNTTKSTRTTVSKVNSESELEVVDDIFVKGDSYEIRFY